MALNNQQQTNVTGSFKHYQAITQEQIKSIGLPSNETN